ncbi:uncharacterized protein LOC127803651 isoform X2 [Diospyros lotus]|uniref:uncharacterized protein LOC127803651 isoform X2 n=1 Tax=Diospyros lotus TaxID=55363 RepID=UPI002254FE03|nr:uncharacterized protein LOC127803651 isoform X2 [Diospyros lotus]
MDHVLPGDGRDAGGSAAAPSSDERDMITTSLHYFGDPIESADAFSITIIESMKEDYGLFVWPCSVVLAEYVWQQRSRFSGISVLELGAGTSLPGLVAAKVGSDVTLTDASDRPEVLANMRRVSDSNNLNCKVNHHPPYFLIFIYNLDVYIMHMGKLGYDGIRSGRTTITVGHDQVLRMVAYGALEDFDLSCRYWDLHGVCGMRPSLMCIQKLSLGLMYYMILVSY